MRQALPPRGPEYSSVSEEIDANIAALDDWRGVTMARLRGLIKHALPDVEDKIQWRKPSNPGGVPTWHSGGLPCTGETYKDKVKLTFMKGNAVADPTNICTGGFAGTRRVIDLFEGDDVNDSAFKALMQSAAALNNGA
jgi:hypothetical protein